MNARTHYSLRAQFHQYYEVRRLNIEVVYTGGEFE